MPKNRKRSAAGDDRDVVALFVGFVSLIMGYFLAEGLLAPFLHPVHWLAAGLVALLGYILAVFIYSRLLKSRKP